MSNEHDRVAYYQSEAARCRVIAETSPYRDIKESYLRVAQQWEDLARQASAGLPEIDDTEPE